MEPTAEPSGTTTSPPAPPPPPEGGSVPPQKNPILAAILSGFPGVGHVYNGLYLRGVTFFLIAAGCIYLADQTNDGLWGFAVAFVWIFNILDAYRQATLINLGYAADMGLTDQPKPGRAGQGTLMAGIVLVVLGVLFFLDIHFNVDLDKVLEFLGPLGLVVLGGWFIWSALKARRERRDEDAVDSLGEA